MAIKAEELRIGNWVSTGKDCFTEVESIWHGGINVSGDYGNSVSAEYTWSQLNGIPLTREIVKKCNFLDQPNYTVFYIKNLEFHETSGYKIGYFSDNEYGHDSDDEVKIEYLHQLQNLYFALTGEELKYNP